MYHPVIDAVGLFSRKGGGVNLAYFQVSMSSYSDHSTKIKDLFDNNCGKRGYTELTTKCPTIDKYYKRKVLTNNPAMYYVYLYHAT